MRTAIFSIVILLLACNKQEPIKEPAKPQPVRVVYKAKTKAELFAYTWRARKAIMYINKHSITFKHSKFKDKIKWISDTSFTAYNYYEISHEEPEIKKLDTIIFWGEADWIMEHRISKQQFITESIEIYGKYYRHEKR